MKVAVISVCKNEEKMLPWFLRHYDFADEIHIHDNGSTDKSLEIMKANPKVKVIPFVTDGLDDKAILDIKNNYYKTLDADWFIIVDMDEFIWHQDIRRYLELCAIGNITIPKVKGFRMIGNGWPIDDNKSSLLDLCKSGLNDIRFNKYAVIHKSVDVNYDIGAHFCDPKGFVVYSTITELKLLHYHWIDKEWRIQKQKEYYRTYSKWNKEHNNIIPEVEHDAATFDMWKEWSKNICSDVWNQNQNQEKMKITVISVCKNEEKILPLFLRHYDFADEIHIHDNGSTDKSLEIMKANPKVKIIPLMGNVIDIKYNYYKTLDADWYIIVDMNEFVCHKLPQWTIRKYLEDCQDFGITVPQIISSNKYVIIHRTINYSTTELASEIDYIVFSNTADIKILPGMTK